MVVDLGAAPGAWSQYLRRRFAPQRPAAAVRPAASSTARIIALDLLDFEPIEGVHFIQGDFRDDAVLQQLDAALGGRPVDVVVSDMAPNLSGIESARRGAHGAPGRTGGRVRACATCSRDGALVCKVFHGSGYSQLAKLFKDSFRVVKPIKPKASRDKSSETFLVGIGLKPG